jgi:PAS domain S-box-containing protein
MDDNGMGAPAGMTPMAEQAEFIGAIANNSPAMLWLGDEVGRCVFLNDALRRFWGVDPKDLGDFDWSSTLHPEDIEMLAGPFAKAMAAHTPFSVAARYRRADGEFRTMRTEANPRFGADGTFLGMTGVNVDITEQLVAEDHTRLLMNELNHRTKNILTVVQALARQTMRTSSPEEFLATYDARLMGLAASNDLLLRNEWSGVQLGDLVEAQFSHIADLLGTRLIASGPPLRIGSRGAQTMGMALHELSTNSLKYGALADPEGKVALTWGYAEDGGWHMEWREILLRPVAAPSEPSRKGFGHTVIVNMIEATFGAAVTTEFTTHGFVWRATVPMA